MQSLVAFSLLVVAALADPQVYVPGYAGVAGVVPSAGVYGAYPFAGGYVAGSPVVTKSAVYPYAAPYATPYATPYVAAVTYPSQDTSRGLPQPVQDTPAVQAAKANFAAEYQRTAVRNALATPYGTPFYGGAVAIETRHKRDLKAVQTPASTSPLYTVPYAAAAVAPYAAVATPYAATPYAYGAATPYAYGAAAPYGYGAGYYNTYASYPYAY